MQDVAYLVWPPDLPEAVSRVLFLGTISTSERDEAGGRREIGGRDKKLGLRGSPRSQSGSSYRLQRGSRCTTHPRPRSEARKGKNR